MTAALALALASALLGGDLPAAARVQKLSGFFSPRVGEPLTVETREVRDLAREGRIRPEQVRGFVVVAPPKGTCLTIERPAITESEDNVVCKKTALAFNIEELDKAGRLNWRVSTGEGDFGTDVSWPSRYRRALLVPFPAPGEEEQQVTKYVDTCVADPRPGLRSVKLTLLTGEHMTLWLPDVDVLMKQPEPMPLLYVAETPAAGDGKKDGGEHGEKKESGEHAEKSGEHAEKGAEHEEKKEGAEHGEKSEHAEKSGEHTEAAPPPPPSRSAKIFESEDRKEWAFSRRDSYAISSDHLSVHGSPTPGLKGECRYNYNGPKDDPRTGRVECHDADGYKLVYLPLTCLGETRRGR